MIIYDPRSYSDVLFRLHGSVIPVIATKLLAVCLVATAAVIYNEANPDTENPLPDDAHKIFGFLVGFLLVFRSTIAHKVGNFHSLFGSLTISCLVAVRGDSTDTLG